MTFRETIEVTEELANYVAAKRTELNFVKPTPNLNRSDCEAVRNLILSLT